MTQTSKIQVRNLCKSFKNKTVLNNVSFEAAKGESVALIGASGTGKSVILKCILKLFTPDSGNIFINGVSMQGISERQYNTLMSECGVVFQGSALFDSLKIWENVAFSLIYRQKIPSKEARERAIETLKDVGLEPRVADLYSADLSGGMQRRVALARAIISKPSLLFFDEPTTGLDPIMSGVINDLIVQSVRNIGATAITITHDMTSVRHIADRVLLLHKGQIIWQGKTTEIDSSSDSSIRQFVEGAPQGPLTL